jgi:hypothetical protein
MRLRPCAQCGRHVRDAERRCPFCAAALEPAAPAVGPIVPRGIGRAALLAFGALATAPGCTDPSPVGGLDAASEPTDAWVGGDAASGPPDAAHRDAPIPPSDTGGGGNLYGGPPADAANGDDAGGPVPLYGGAGV